ncbi:MAG TPA: biotin--[acetyl-CoA-carboxylase] ligase [Chloroflexota bacterium]|nr:biotin--[acetyl-CoA-carboxylase] ligase [Chloroflexota bacterium]
MIRACWGMVESMASYRPLSERAISRDLRTRTIGSRIVCLQTVGSTNDWIAAAAREGAAEGLAVFAEEQTAGRGQAGHRWVAPVGRCLLGSVLLRPPVPPSSLFLLTMLAATAAAAATSELSGLPIRLKWPNDLIGPRGKIGGILVETSILGERVEYAVVGIGINVNLPRRMLTAIPGADSLQAAVGHRLNRNHLARALLRHLDARYSLLRGGRAAAIADEWRNRLGTLGRRVRLRRDGKEDIPLVAEGVTDDGALIVRAPDGSQLIIRAGEVSIQEE